jgi:hypothetical protein
LGGLQGAGELAARADAELAVDAGEVVLDRLRGDEQLLGDLAVGAAGRGVLGDPPLRGDVSSSKLSRRGAAPAISSSSAAALAVPRAPAASASPSTSARGSSGLAFQRRLTGERSWRGRRGSLIPAAGFTRFRRATETPFNLILEARP